MSGFCITSQPQAKQEREQELGEALAAAACRAVKGRSRIRHVQGEGAHGAKHHCQHRRSKSNRLHPGGRHRHVDRGYCRIQKSAQKIYKGSERGQSREHQSSHLPVSSHCCSWAFTGLANPIIPL